MDTSLSVWTTFEEYYQAAMQLLLKRRPGISEQILAANLPFEKIPHQATDKACVLIHGLYDSPFTMLDIANCLYEQGYHVLGVLLPGHGTQAEDLVDIDMQQWRDCTASAINYLRQSNSQVLIAGFSTGAALAVDYASHHKTEGLLLFSPAIKLLSTLSFLLPYHKLLAKISPRLKWIQNYPENDMARYRRHAMNAGYQVYRLSKILKNFAKLPPTFLAASMRDEVVNPHAALQLFKNNPHQTSKAILYGQHNTNDSRIILRSGKDEANNIIDFSHLAIPIANNNLHYGKKGEFKEKVIHLLYKKSQTKIGATLMSNLMKYNIERLLYNPDFQYLSDEIAKFVRQL